MKDWKTRKVVNTTLDVKLYKQLKVLAAELDTTANSLLEEGMKMVIDKYKEKE